MKLILLGPPGSGKGTVAEKLEKEFHLISISAGELLREEVNKKTSIGKEIKKYIDGGDLVPDEFVTQLIRLEIERKDNYILDGFPRSIEQAKAVEDLHISTVIYLNVPEKVAVERLSGRRVCTKGEHSYHLKYLPPKKAGVCDHDCTTLVQRKDDSPKVVRERFKVYAQKTAPVVRYYQKKRILKRVDASSAPEIVYAAVKKMLRK